MKIITLTLFFSWWIIEGNDVGKVVVCVVVATGILGKVVPYALVLKPTPKDGNDGCWWVTIPPVRPKPSSFGRIDCNKEKKCYIKEGMELILLSQHGKIHSFLLVPRFSLGCSIFLAFLVLRTHIMIGNFLIFRIKDDVCCSVTHGDVTPEVNLSIKFFILDSRNAIYWHFAHYALCMYDISSQ